jgi:hypothetical protein
MTELPVDRSTVYYYGRNVTGARYVCSSLPDLLLDPTIQEGAPLPKLATLAK